jgi:hypothetical protein
MAPILGKLLRQKEPACYKLPSQKNFINAKYAERLIF